MTGITPTERRALGDFVRAQREHLMPAQFGLPTVGRRRTPGLRREEIAQLAGLSTTWYSWIEQGRDVSVSPHALARLAATLRLSRAERAYLFALAGKRDPDDRPPEESTDLPAALTRAVDGFVSPAYVLDRLWQARAWNAPAATLFANWLGGAGDRNLLRYIFLEPSARRFICDWEERARRVVAEFRADAIAALNEPSLRALVDELCRRSAVFAEMWNAQTVVAREGGERRFADPAGGVMRYQQVTFSLAARPEFKLVLLTLMPSAAR
jgi:transcriptional regulator with XRE-family HTH domain